MSARPVLHEYRVALAGEARLVDAPSATAAAAYFELQRTGHVETLAAVLEEDGKPFRGVQAWMRWALGDELEPADLELLKAQLPFCRWARTAPARRAA